MIDPSAWDYLKRLRWGGAGPDDRNIVVDDPDLAASLDAYRRAIADDDDPELKAIRAAWNLDTLEGYAALYGLEPVSPGVWADPDDEFRDHPFIADAGSARPSGDVPGKPRGRKAKRPARKGSAQADQAGLGFGPAEENAA
jgi:hypothetical protein